MLNHHLFIREFKETFSNSKSSFWHSYVLLRYLFMVTIVKSDFEFRRESNQFVHCMPTSHQISMLYYGRQRPKESGRKTTYLWSYSLICIRQNYNFDMLAAIWLEIVSWFLTISQDLRNMITKLFLFWISYQCRTILWSQQTRMGKKQKSTNNDISNDGSSIEIIDWSHGD